MSRVDVHQTVCTVDLAGYGDPNRTRSNRVALRAGMYGAVEQAFADSGIPWADCFRQDVGDNLLLLAPPTVGKGAFAGPLPGALVNALNAHNNSHPPAERIKMRLALDSGEITYDGHGVASRAIIHASRLLNAAPVKTALARSPGPLSMIVSDWFYTEVVSQHAAYAPEMYWRVHVDVKETSDVGWVRTPGHETLVPAPAVVDTAPAVVTQLRPATPRFHEVVVALEEIPCMQGEHTRAQLVDQLPFAGVVRYFPARRAHVTSILRTSLDFENGVVELLTVISNQEPSGSLPLKRLLALLTGGSR